ncbi:MAG: hypothetical protein K6U87_12395 [Firmicutes bacterium]|nr:hypothetical protein [Bacillota bacterium]
MTIKRWGVSLAAAILAVFFVASPAAASTPTSKVGMEMLVLLPEKGQLAVYQQVAMKPPLPNPVIGILRGASQVSVVGAQASLLSGDAVRVNGSPSSFAIRYFVPWNQRSATLTLPLYLASNALVLLIPSQLSVPQVLNPALASMGSGKIPGIANSPVFQEYATANLPQGEGFTIVVERAGLTATGQSPVLPAPTSPWVSRGFEAAILAAVAGGLLLAVNWKPAWRWSYGLSMRERLLRELATLDASYRRQEMAEEDWHRNRAEILQALSRVWYEAHG